MAELFPEDIAGYAQIAVERAVDRYPHGLTYAVPRALGAVSVGERVVAPLGRGGTPTAGYVVEVMAETSRDPASVKPLTARDRAGAALPGELVELARWISAYYHAPIGVTLAGMIPAAVKKNIGAMNRTMLDLGDPLPLEEKLPPKQRALLETLADMPPERRPVEQRALMELAAVKTAGPVKALIERGLLETTTRTVIEANWAAKALDPAAPARLTDEQQAAVDAIGRTLGDGFSAHLLFGVTGSGKTEVYIQLLERVLAMGKAAIVMVPEIALTPQTGGRLIARLTDYRCAVLHSGLTAAQRNQQWTSVAEGRAKLVIGARSAVFAPVPDGDLGLIIVDEEHDNSYKQDQAPRYHGRDVAVRRAQLCGCTVVAGSATPSLESWFNATMRGSYALHRLTRRAPGLRTPEVRIVDLARERRARGNDRQIHLIGPVLEETLRETLEGDGQALLLLNRRGFANYVACASSACGWVMQCDDCDVAMVFHRSERVSEAKGGGYVVCHHCQSQRMRPTRCPDCNRSVITFGLGTQRVEAELSRKFAGLVSGDTMVRMDSDTMRRGKDYETTLERFGAGEIRVLLGTQMIAKGLDYPGVRLVGVVNADTSMHMADFRASERTFQLVSQVAGRCGRSDTPGVAIVQTFSPQDAAIIMAAQQDYATFAARELTERQRSALPPTTRMARVVVRDADWERCVQRAKAAEQHLRQLAGPELRIRPASPCAISRIAGKHRWQVEVFGPDAVAVQQVLTRARNLGLIQSDAAMVVDVDPVGMM